MSVRVFVPMTSRELQRLVDAGSLAEPWPAHAVTDQLRQAWAEADEEEWEFSALLAAADESAERYAEGDRPRRYVLALDVPGVAERPEGYASPTASAVWLPEGFAFTDIASLHTDLSDGASGPDTSDDDLAWFARQEIRSQLG